MTIKQDLFLANQWYKAHRAVGLWPDWKEFLEIRAAYGQEGRYYHTWQHIYECVKFVDLHYGKQPLVVFALFYHDIVYDVARKDNEQMSAAVWTTYASKRLLYRHSSLKLKMVNDLINMTAKHKVEVGQPLAFQIMCDADMHVFLCPDDHYLKYARNIWREYQSFGREEYLKGRLAFLATCNPTTLFYTHQAKALVHHARANLDLERTILETDPDRLLT